MTLFVCKSNRKMNDELWVGSVTKILDKKKSSSPLNFLSSNNSNLLLYYYSVPNLFWLASSSIVQLMPSQRYTLFKIQFSKIDLWFFGPKLNFWIVYKKKLNSPLHGKKYGHFATKPLTKRLRKSYLIKVIYVQKKI